MSATFRNIPVAEIRPHRKNVRDDLGNLDELAASLRTNGVQQPIIVADRVTHFELIDGHRRYAAAVKAGLKGMPAIITDIHDSKRALVAMLAAAMHKQLTPIEQAKAFADLLREPGMTTATIAHSTGYTVNTVKNRLLLLELPAEVTAMVAAGDLTLGEAVDMAKQVKRTGNATGTKAAPRSIWLGKTHPLAARVAEACDCDPATVVKVGGIGCGKHWENVIRADEQAWASRGGAA